MVKHNQHWRQTHDQLQTLTFALLKTTPPEQITVSQLCAAAHINRSTFYAHYQDVFNLVDQTQANKRRELMAGFTEHLPAEATGFLTTASLTVFLDFIKTNGWFYKIVLKSRTHFPIEEGFGQLSALLLDLIKKRHPKMTDDDLLYVFVAFQAGFTTILRRWAEADYDLPTTHVARLIRQSLPSLIAEALAAGDNEPGADPH